MDLTKLERRLIEFIRAVKSARNGLPWMVVVRFDGRLVHFHIAGPPETVPLDTVE